MRFGSGPLYKPSTKDFEPSLQAVCPDEKARLTNIWNYWEADDATEPDHTMEDELHPDHRIG